MVVTPAGGAQKVSYVVALLVAENLKLVVLSDEEPKARNAAEELLKNKLVRDENLAFVTEGFGTARSGDAGVEDLLNAETFARLVGESYARELAGKELELNDRIPRIVKRYEEAFSALGMNFHETRPAKLCLRKMAESPEGVLAGKTEERSERLFAAINSKAATAERRDGRPFG